MSTSRTDFNRTWLSEMPEGIGSFGTYDQLVYNINDLKKAAASPTIIDLGNNLLKIDLESSVYYWIEINNEIIIGCELQKKPQGLVVSITGKNPKYKGKPPFASDLYNAILKDAGHSIRLLSDAKLSDEGYAIWKRLFNAGHKISIYNNQDPGRSFHTFNNIEEFESFFNKSDSNYQRYQYILTESENKMVLCETRINFRMRRFRELVPGLGVTDLGEE